ncbi:MAG TPA: hypothetical protein VFY67_10025 [Pyrinomonadaceae bacterium]|nr:hypothetical protein [Pyrinomonadaceae bacterium]
MGQRRRGLTVMGIKGTAAVVLMFALLNSTVVAQQPQQRGTLEDPPWLKEFVHKTDRVHRSGDDAR